jgi:uncharacterized protein YukE
MSGRFIDVLGQSFWLPDPGEVSQLASSFGAIENNLADTLQQVQALRSPQSWAQWSGRAAGVFASQLSTVPTQLSEAHEAYATVTAALSNYATGLNPVHSAIGSLVTEGEEAETNLQAETAELNRARQASDHQAVTYWTSRVDAAEENVRSLGTRLTSLYGELNGLAETCAWTINHAQHDGMSSSVFGDIGHDLSKVAGGTGHLFDQTFISPFTKLQSDWDRRDWGDLLEDLGDAVSVVSLAIGVLAVVAVFSIGTFGIGDAALAGALLAGAGELGLGAKVVSAGLYGAAFDVDTYEATEGQPGDSEAGMATSAVSFVSNAIPGPFGDEAANDGFDGVNAMLTTGLNDFLQNKIDVPAVTSQTPDDVVSGLLMTSSSVQGLQSLPTSTASAGSASFLQPAVGVPSPATVSIQRVRISPEVGIQ